MSSKAGSENLLTHTKTLEDITITNDENREENDMEYEVDYNSVLIKSKSLVIRMFLLSVTQIFMRGSRHPIWIPFAQQFESPIHPSVKLAAAVVSISMIWRGISGLIYVSLSNKIGYDKGLIILIFVNTGAIFMECITHNFIVLAIGLCLSQTAIYDVVLAAIAWILPRKQATRYTSYLNASSIFSFIAGPAVAGAVAYFVNYRWVFWVNFILGCVIFVYSVFFVKINSQNKLEMQQINIKYKMQTNDEIKYPIYIKKKQNRKFKYKGKQTRISLFEYIMIFLSIFAKSLALSNTSIWGFYYIHYIQDYIYPGKKGVAYGAMQLLSNALGGITGTIVTMALCKKRMFGKYMILLISSAAYGSVIYFLFLDWNHAERNLFYLYSFGCGLLGGCFTITAQLITLEVQSPSKAGYVSGFACLLSASCKASALYFIGHYWEQYKNIMFYTLIYVMILSFISSFLMGIVHVCYNRYSKTNKYRDGHRANESTTIKSTKSTYSTAHSIN